MSSNAEVAKTFAADLDLIGQGVNWVAGVIADATADELIAVDEKSQQQVGSIGDADSRTFDDLASWLWVCIGWLYPNLVAGPKVNAVPSSVDIDRLT